MAVPRPRFDHRNGRILHHVLNQSLAATGNEHVDITPHIHQNLCALPVGGGNQLHAMGIKTALRKCRLDQLYQLFVGVNGFFSATKHHGVSGLQAESGRIHRHVGAGFINDRHHAERHPDVPDGNARGALPRLSLSDRVLQIDKLLQRAADRLHPFFAQRQPVNHRLCQSAVRRPVQIQPVGSRQLCGVFPENPGNAEQNSVFLFGVGKRQLGRRRLGIFA